MTPDYKTSIACNVSNSRFWQGSFVAFVVLGLQACTTTGINTPVVSDIAFGGMTQRPANFCQPHHGTDCAPNLAEFPSFAEIGKEISVLPLGKGTCGRVSIDFGDGTPPRIVQNLPIGDATNPGRGVQHTYNGWPGRKLVRVKGSHYCLGDESKMLMVGFNPDERGDLDLGFVPNNLVCNVVPDRPPLRKGSVVRIWADAVIQYGPFIAFNASGDLSSPAPANFPFPIHRKFSVVYKVGSSQLEQGENGSVVFRVNETARLEICLNDHPNDLRDNRGAGHFKITVNEVSAE